MIDIGYGLAWNFFDFGGRPCQLCLPRDRPPATTAEIVSGTGQLVGVIADPHRRDNNDIVAISRPGVRYTDVEQALDGWRHWARVTEETVDLLKIRRRIRDAGLD